MISGISCDISRQFFFKKSFFITFVVLELEQETSPLSVAGTLKLDLIGQMFFFTLGLIHQNML